MQQLIEEKKEAVNSEVQESQNQESLDDPEEDTEAQNNWNQDIPDDLEESLELLIKRDNPMADAAKKTRERL